MDTCSLWSHALPVWRCSPHGHETTVELSSVVFPYPVIEDLQTVHFFATRSWKEQKREDWVGEH